MARYIDANILKEKILEERDKIPLKRVERYSFGVETPYRDGQAMRGGIRKALRCLEQTPTADVVPKSNEGAECPTCHGTGRIGTTDWLTKNISKKQLAEEKAQAIAEHEQYIKTEYAREIFEEIEEYAELQIKSLNIAEKVDLSGADFFGGGKQAFVLLLDRLAELKKKYTKGQENQ